MKTFLFVLLFVAGGVNLAVMMSGKTYIYRALIYREPGIDDAKLFPYREVTTTNPTPAPLAEDYNRRTMPAELQELLEKNRSTQLVVLQNGRLSFEKYWGNGSESQRSNAFSATKTLLATLIGIAVQQQYIHSIEDPVGKYLSGFDTASKRHIRVRDVLMMSSGLSFQENYSGLISDTTEAYYGSDLNSLIDRLTVTDSAGELWRYRSGDTQLLAMLLAAATDSTVSDFASKHLWQPLGAEHSALWSLDRKGGIEKAFCCFYATARDLAKVGELYRNGGVVGGNALFSANFLQQAITPNRLVDNQGEIVSWYGMHWWIKRQQGEELFYARGILGQYIFVIPSRGLVVVRLGHQREAIVDHHPADVEKMLDGIFAMYPK